jgi:hypothetical protein
MEVRRGEWSESAVLAEIDRVEEELRAAVAESTLPDAPDAEGVDAFIVESYREAWEWG